MEVLRHFSLLPYNTFGLPAVAEYFTRVTGREGLAEALEFARSRSLFVLGGGSNILFTRDVPGLTLRMEMSGTELVSEDADHYYIKAGAGVNWHTLVMHCVENGYAGIENLSLIPGSVGAGPMQNIGAYGVELKDVFHALEAVHIPTGEARIFTLSECEFDYRSSIFKTREKGNYIITSVTLRLRKQPEFQVSYGAISQELEAMGVQTLSIRAISDAVIRIRRSKLPDPAEIGNAGSFFKNPVISAEQFRTLKAEFPDIASYPQPDGTVKIAAGWLIEKGGWKGKTLGNCGVHKNQALVLVNYGGATGAAIYQLSEDILRDIHQKFGIALEREVNIV